MIANFRKLKNLVIGLLIFSMLIHLGVVFAQNQNKYLDPNTVKVSLIDSQGKDLLDPSSIDGGGEGYIQ